MNNNSRILVTDDDETLCYLLKEELVTVGFNVDVAYDGKPSIEAIKKNKYDVLLLDLEMREVHGEEVLEFVKDNYPSVQVIVLTAKTDIRTAIDCIKRGAYDFITKPYDFHQLMVVINRALEHKNLVEQNAILVSKYRQTKPNNIIGESKPVKDVINLAGRAAKSDSNILLEGETGTGKELFAEFIHESSNRNHKPLVAINCASLPDQLIESELFGFEKGAFTDAKQTKQGLVEIADGGTLFLDEIGEMSLTLQPKLLRFLEKGEYRRVGGVTNLTANVRVIGATNKNLMVEAERKNFRKDLLFRLNVITLTIPPLRKRGNDVTVLANYFLEKKSPVRKIKRLSEEAEKALLEYGFPGNVRELEHTIERALIFAEGETISKNDLNLPKGNYMSGAVRVSPADAAMNMDEESGAVPSLEDVEREHIHKALASNDWNREETARVLGISQKTLYTKIKKYDLKK